MAEQCCPPDAVSEEEREFQKVLTEIGGRERIHLVSDIGKSKEDDDAGVLQDFLRDVFSQTSFPNGLLLSAQRGGARCDLGHEKRECGKTALNQAAEVPLTVKPKAVREEVEERSDSAQKTVTRRRTNISSSKRTIDCPIIVFLFRQTYVSCQENQLSLKEILRDVKARTKRAKIAQPALVGLIRTTSESAVTKQCAQLLETMMHSVFHRQVTDSMWIGSFIPKKEENILEIKKHICRVIYSSRTADNPGHRRNLLLWPFQCLFGPDWRAAGAQANSSSAGHSHTGNREEEGIPLKTSNQSASARVDEESAGNDS